MRVSAHKPSKAPRPKRARTQTCPHPNLPGPNLPGPNLPGPNMPVPNVPVPNMPGPNMPAPPLVRPKPVGPGSYQRDPRSVRDVSHAGIRLDAEQPDRRPYVVGDSVAVSALRTSPLKNGGATAR